MNQSQLASARYPSQILHSTHLFKERAWRFWMNFSLSLPRPNHTARGARSALQSSSSDPVCVRMCHVRC